MARKKSSPAEDFMELIAMLPWWMGVALAAFFFLLLHGLAKPPAHAPVASAQMGQFVSQTLFASLASVGQYIVPLFCLIGALGSYLRRRKRTRLASDMAGAKSADALHGISWQEFEVLVGEAFRMQGYEVRELGGAGADGGVDLELRKGDELYLVQCKQWKAFKVGVTVIRELYGVMTQRGAAGGFVITSGTYTDDAKQFVRGRNVRLIEGAQLFGLLKQAKARAGRIDPLPAATAPSQPPASPDVPACPVCNAEMVRRTARNGPRSGSLFWGCSRFPACRGTRS